MGNVLKLGLTLMIFCLVAAAALAYVNTLTAPVISKYSLIRELEAKRALFLKDRIDLQLFPDGKYEYSENGKDVIAFNFVNTAFENFAINPEYFTAEEQSEIPEITNKLQIEQFIDFERVPQKNKKIYNSLVNAFMSGIKFDNYFVVNGFSGNNIRLNQITDDSVYITANFKNSTLFFVREDDNRVRLEKIDESYVEEIKKEGKIIYNNGTVEDFDGKTIFDVVEYDKVSIGSKFLGYVIKIAPSAYSSNIETLIGIDEEGKIAGLKIISQQETPGLGAKCQEDWFMKQFVGLSGDELELRGKTPQGKIESITAATITSDAVTTGVRQGVESFRKIIQAGVLE
ncbi:MAG: FMN-binding protein [Candidatus Muiribacteriota bacterium]